MPEEEDEKKRELPYRIVCACEDLKHAAFVEPSGDGYRATGLGMAVSEYRDDIDVNLLRRIPSFRRYEESGEDDESYKKYRRKTPIDLVPKKERDETFTRIEFDEIVGLRMRDTWLSNMLDGEMLYFNDGEVFVYEGMEIPQRELNLWKRKGKKRPQKVLFGRRNGELFCAKKTEESIGADAGKGTEGEPSGGEVKSGGKKKKSQYGERGSRNEEEVAKDLRFIRQRWQDDGQLSFEKEKPFGFYDAFKYVSKRCGISQNDIASKIAISYRRFQRDMVADKDHIPKLSTLTASLIVIDAPGPLGVELMRMAGYDTDSKAPYVARCITAFQLHCEGKSIPEINQAYDPDPMNNLIP